MSKPLTCCTWYVSIVFFFTQTNMATGKQVAIVVTCHLCMGQEMETQLGLNLQENVNRREQIKETTDSAEIPENSFTYTAT